MKKLAVLFLIEFIVGFVAAPAMAAGKSKVGHLYLYEKDPSTWEIVDGGAWGKMKYNLAGPEFEFTFTGRRLRPGTTYMLIVYPNSGHTAYCIAGGTANGRGKINIAGSAELNRDLVDNPDTIDTYGAKIWLVLEDDVDCDNQTRTDWNPTEYLFENNGILYNDKDV